MYSEGGKGEIASGKQKGGTELGRERERGQRERTDMAAEGGRKKDDVQPTIATHRPGWGCPKQTFTKSQFSKFPEPFLDRLGS